MSRFTDRIDNRFIYTSAADSSKPNYLRRKFAAIQRGLDAERAKQKAEAEANNVELAVKLHVLKGAK